MPAIPLGGNFYQSESLPISAQECVNFYASIPETVSTTKKNLFVTPGIKGGTTAGSNVANRGAHNFQGSLYVVNGTDLYRIDQSTDSFGNDTYSSTKVNGGTSLPGAERVFMEDNGDELCILLPDSTDSQNAYIYTTGGGLSQVSDTDFDGPASTLVFIAGYFGFTKADGRKFFISELRDGTSYLSTDFVDAESDPDDTVGAFVLGDVLYLFGERTLQSFQNVGGTGFPFQAITGSVQNVGMDSKYAIAEVNDYMIFLGSAGRESPAIWISGGGRPEKLSTIAIENEISRYSDDVIDSAYTWKYSEAGAQFIAFTFPGEACFVYDFRSKLWHMRESIDGTESAIESRISTITHAYGVLLVGDRLSNKIGVLSRDTYTEFGDTIRRRFVTPHLDNDGDPFFINQVRLVCESGVGLTSGQGSDPLVSLSISKDGGKTFSDRLERSIGKIGEYQVDATWNQLGRVPREACARFDMSDPVKWVVRKVEMDLDR